MSINTKVLLWVALLFTGPLILLTYVHKAENAQPSQLKTPPEWRPMEAKPVGPVIPPASVPPPQPTPPPPSKAPTTYDEALAQAKATNKKVVLFFTIEGCSWCEKMKRETLSDPAVKASLQSYIFVEIRDQAIAEKYKVRGYPTTVMIDKEEIVIKELYGYKPADEFNSWLGGNQKRQPWIINRPKTSPPGRS